MAVSTYTACGSYASTASVTTSGAVALSAAVPAGALLVVTIAGGATGITFGVTDSKSNTWSSSTQSSTSAPAGTLQVYWCITNAAMTTTDTITVTRSTSGGLQWTASYATGASGSLGNSGTVLTANTATASSAVAFGSTLSAEAGSLSHFAVLTATTVTVSTAGGGYAFHTGGASSGSGNPRRGSTLQQAFTTANGSVAPTATLSAASGGWAALALTFTQSVSGATSTVAETVTIASTMSKTVPAPAPTLASIGDSTTDRQGTAAAPPDRQADTTAVMVNARVVAGAGSYSWYGKGGKPMIGNDANGQSAAQSIANARTAVGKVNRWVIGLGTNDVGVAADSDFTAGVNAILNTIYASGANADEQVLWVNLAYYSAANTNAARFNPLLAAAIAAHANTATIRYLDWNEYSHRSSVFVDADWNGSGDAAHMSTTGWPKRDAYIAAALQNLSAPVAETVTITSSAARGVTGSSSVAETVGVASTATVGKSATSSVAQTVAIASAATVVSGAASNVAETVGIVSSAAVSANVASAVTATPTIASTVVAGVTAPVAQTVTISSSAAVTTGANAPVSQTVTISSTATVGAVATAAVAEAVTISSTATRAALMASGPASVVAIDSTATVGAAGTTGNVSETVTITSAATVAASMASAVAETVAVTSGATVGRVAAAAVSATVTITSSMTLGAPVSAQVAQTATVTSSASVAVSAASAVAATVTITSSVSVARTATSGVTQTVTISSSVSLMSTVVPVVVIGPAMVPTVFIGVPVAQAALGDAITTGTIIGGGTL